MTVDIKRMMQRSAAGFMAVWLSGFVFLFCCQNMRAAAEAEFCPMAKMGHCDHAQKADPNAASFEKTQPVCVDCCAFLPAVFDKTRKVEPAQKHLAQATLPKIAIAFNAPVVEHIPTIAALSNEFVANGRSTHLRHCVFRI